jgi:hypothetical protein
VTVEPVIHAGVRYVALNDDGRHAYIEAWDVQTNKKLWELTVFTNGVDPKLEEDVQWVFVKSLSLRGGMLMITSERGRTYQIDLKTKAITQSDPAQSDLSFRMNPFYLSGDFNGDGKIDIAVLVKQRTTGKLGIAIVHGATDKVTMRGAGVAIGNGGDDFEWMGSWRVYSKDSVAREAGAGGVPHLHGDALLVSKSEAASALIYWNGSATSGCNRVTKNTL